RSGGDQAGAPREHRTARAGGPELHARQDRVHGIGRALRAHRGTRWREAAWGAARARSRTARGRSDVGWRPRPAQGIAAALFQAGDGAIVRAIGPTGRTPAVSS